MASTCDRACWTACQSQDRSDKCPDGFRPPFSVCTSSRSTTDSSHKSIQKADRSSSLRPRRTRLKARMSSLHLVQDSPSVVQAHCSCDSLLYSHIPSLINQVIFESSSSSSSQKVPQPPSSATKSLLMMVLVILFVTNSASACSSRSTPKPRPPSHSAMRPNITFQTYACPPAYAAWYCLNGATCFTVKIADSILYNCECADGYMGQRCEFKDLEGSYLPARERFLMLGPKSKVGSAFLGVLLIAIAAAVGSAVYTKSRTKAKRASLSALADFNSSHQEIKSGEQPSAMAAANKKSKWSICGLLTFGKAKDDWDDLEGSSHLANGPVSSILVQSISHSLAGRESMRHPRMPPYYMSPCTTIRHPYSQRLADERSQPTSAEFSSDVSSSTSTHLGKHFVASLKTPSKKSYRNVRQIHYSI